MDNIAKTNMLLGLLGYVNLNNYENSLKVANKLLEDNNFDIKKIIDLHYALCFDARTETSLISLAGSYATIKIKISEVEELAHYVATHDVEIKIG